MRTVLFLLAQIFIMAVSSAQVIGKLTDSTGKPLQLANITLMKGIDSTFLKATSADINGLFSFSGIGPGNYLVRISNAGYENWQSPLLKIIDNAFKTDLGTIILYENAKELQRVIVRSEKQLIRQQSFGISIHPEASLLTKGSSVLQVLERSPGVALDYRNNGITLNGKQGVMIMLNGKLIRMPPDQVVAMLAGMNADEIEKIDLMSSPPPGFDADGNAGIINIVSKKNRKQGTNGSFTLTAGYGWREKAAASIQFAHNPGKVNLYASYSFFRDRTYSEMFIPSSQNMPVLGGKLNVFVWDTTRARQQNHDLTVGLDWKINPYHIAGINVSMHNSDRRTSNSSNSDFTILPDSMLYFNGYINGSNSWNNYTTTLYFEKKLKDGENINVSFDYLLFKNNSPTNVNSRFVNSQGEPGNNDSMFAASQQGYANTTINTGVLKIDYIRKLNPQTQFEAGVKGSYAGTRSASGINSLVDDQWVIRPETINQITVDEPIAAAYTSFNTALKTDLQFAAGLRFEYSSTTMHDAITKEKLLERNLASLFPTVSLSQKWKDQSELLLSWSKRISRPSYNDLASFIRYSDPTAVFTGNVLLKPTITHNIDLRYNYKNYGFALLYSFDRDPIARYQLTESPQKILLYVSPQNLGSQQQLSLQASMPFKINDWWNMQYSVTASYRQFSVLHTDQALNKKYYAWSGNFSQSFKLPKQYSAELSGWYNSTSYNGSITVSGIGALNIGIKKELQNNKGSFQLSVTDLLQTMKIHVAYGDLTREAFSIKNDVYLDLESRKLPIFKLSYTRSFGTVSKDPHKQTNSAREEKERARND